MEGSSKPLSEDSSDLQAVGFSIGNRICCIGHYSEACYPFAGIDTHPFWGYWTSFVPHIPHSQIPYFYLEDQNSTLLDGNVDFHSFENKVCCVGKENETDCHIYALD